MKRTPTRGRGAWLAVALLVVAVPGTGAAQSAGPEPAPAPDTLQLAVAEQRTADREATAAQERINEIDDETQRLLVQYRTAIGETDSIKAYSAQLRTQIEAQLEEIESIERQLSEVDVTAREVLPLTQRMLDTLGEFVELDVPFLIEERRKRVAALRQVMNAADVTLSEKFRRVVEAYQIEMEYGRTVDAYEAKLGDEADARTVQFLRVGRVALVYQTLDQKETGYWDADQRRWVVDNSFRQAFRHGLDVAKKIVAPDLIVVPVHAPKEAS